MPPAAPRIATFLSGVAAALYERAEARSASWDAAAASDRMIAV